MAVPPDRDDEPVQEFPSFTVDLNAIADWLEACGVDTVAMESTGVYWIPLFELLESRGFTVLLVNARHVKNVSGRKSDVLDCQWIQHLMTYGLLSGAFRPADHVCVLCSLWRQRGMLLRSQARHVQHMLASTYRRAVVPGKSPPLRLRLSGGLLEQRGLVAREPLGNPLEERRRDRDGLVHFLSLDLEA